MPIPVEFRDKYASDSATLGNMNDVGRRAHRLEESVLQLGAQVEEASLRYSNDRNAVNRGEYLKLLRAFADLVLRHKEPGNSPCVQ